MDDRGRALAQYVPSGIPLLRERLWRAALMGLAGGLTGIAIGAAVDQFGRSVADDASPPSLSHDTGIRPATRPGRLAVPLRSAAHRRFEVTTRIGIASSAWIGPDQVARGAAVGAMS